MNLRVFVSYAHAEREYMSTLIDALKNVDPGVSIEWLVDERLQCGDHIHPRIKMMIKDADVWVLLLSPLFQASTYCIDTELSLIRQQCDSRRVQRSHGDGGARDGRICPIVLRDFSPNNDVSLLRDFTWLAKNGPILEGGSREEVAKRWGGVAKTLLDVLRPLASKIGAVTPQCLEDLSAHIRNGTFTPFLGSCCCDLPEHYEHARPRMASRLSNLLQALGEKSRRGADAFALSVAASRQRELLDTAKRTVAAEEAPRDEITPLRVAISSLGALLCELFGEVLARDHKGMTDLRRYVVPRDHVSGLWPELRQTLDEAIAISAQLETDNTTCPLLNNTALCVGAAGIVQKLDALRRVIGPRQEGCSVSAPKAPTSALTDRAGDAPLAGQPERGLGLVHLEWLGDLLWHTLRYDAPLFPSPDDLSFQLSLCAKCPDSVSKTPLGVTAAICQICVPKDRKELSHDRCLGRLVKRFNEQRRRGTPQDASLAGGMARMLALASKRGKGMHVVPDGQGSAGEGKSQSRQSAEPQPLLFSSTLDSDIEAALLAFEIPHFVLFPYFRQEAKELQLGWMLAYIPTPEGTPAHFWDIPPDGTLKMVNTAVYEFARKQKISDITLDRLPGPLVIRLRGAPLIPGPSDDDTRVTQVGANTKGMAPYKHRVLLSSLDFTRELTTPQGLPMFIVELLQQPGRIFCFLGHVHDDHEGLYGLEPEVWKGHAQEDGYRFFAPLSGRRLGIGSSPPDVRKDGAGHCRRFGIGCSPSDDIGRALINSVGITHLNTELSHVGPILMNILGDET